MDRTDEVKAMVEAAGFAFVGLKLEDIFSTGELPLVVSNTSPGESPTIAR